MKILMATANPFPPQHFGGIDSFISTLAKHLVYKGYTIWVQAGLGSSRDWYWLRNRVGTRLRSIRPSRRTRVRGERFENFELFRGWNAGNLHRELAAHLKPDLVMLHGGWGVDRYIGETNRSIPKIFVVHGTPPLECIPLAYDHSIRHFIGVSQFVCDKISFCLPKNNFAKIHRISNLFDRKLYICHQHKPKKILFINPVQAKGLDIAIRLAERLPNFQFLFIGGWYQSRADWRALERRLQHLPNITLRPAMRQVKDAYAQAKILIFPTLLEEGAGRVVIEAQISGIPVIASNKGGVPEFVGDGGIVLDPNDMLAWQDALVHLMEDHAYYRELSDNAFFNSRRLRFDLDENLRRIEAIMLAAADGSVGLRQR